MKRIHFLNSILVLALFLTGCSALNAEYSENAVKLFTAQELQSFGQIPNRAKVNGNYLSVVFLDPKGQKTLRIYDLHTLKDKKPIFETPKSLYKDFVDPIFSGDTFAYAATKDFSNYDLFLGDKKLATVKNLRGLVFDTNSKGESTELFYTVLEKNDTVQYYWDFSVNKPAKNFVASNIDEMHPFLGDSVAFRVLRKDGLYMALYGPSSEPYSFISRLAVSKTGKLGFVGKQSNEGEKDHWFTWYDSKITPLDYEYREIISVFASDENQVTFLGERKADKPTFDVVVSGKVKKSFDSPPDSFTATDEGEPEYIFMKGTPYTQIENLTVDGKGEVWFRAKDSTGGWYVTNDPSKPTGTYYNWVSDLFLNPEKRIIYLTVLTDGSVDFVEKTEK